MDYVTFVMQLEGNASLPIDVKIERKLQTNCVKLYLDYLDNVCENDGRTLKWHINQALEQYVMRLK